MASLSLVSMMMMMVKSALPYDNDDSDNKDDYDDNDEYEDDDDGEKCPHPPTIYLGGLPTTSQLVNHKLHTLPLLSMTRIW